ncbi:MAG: phospholipid transporter ATP-binding protein MlaF [Gammaproteobacteria bacterium]|jgi:phospholipid/cholesterol/gamma-HCH transport system ATP-binding protein|nr:phospholipid transporter ATP-binding protein MlaF [Gammaproteobacteria bacterium]
MAPDTPLVIVDNLSYQRDKRVIFDQVSLRIPRSKITAILGPSGTGKTTLLKLIGAKLKPTQGNVHVDGRNIHSLSRPDLYRFRERIGMLFQNGALFTHLSTFDNVAFPLREHTKLPESMIRDLVLMKLDAVGLRGAQALMPAELSGGMARRVALARAIALDPMLIMYDEPFTGQDPISMGVLIKLIRRMNDALDMTSIIVSHDVAETLSIADYVYVLANGKVVAEGTPSDLQHDTGPFVSQFMHGLPDGAVPFHYPANPFIHDLLGDNA